VAIEQTPDVWSTVAGVDDGVDEVHHRFQGEAYLGVVPRCDVHDISVTVPNGVRY
jgi:hypothetical protein